MSDIGDFASSVPNFYAKTAVEQLLILAWFMEARLQRNSFGGTELRQCFREVGAEAPDMSIYIPRLLRARLENHG